MHHYNFPPYSVGETGFMRGPEAARHRPRRARTARAGAGDSGPRGLPVHDPPRLRDARVERLLLDGLGVRLDAGADGRRRADQRPSPASRWASSRRATTTSSSPTSRARRTTSATWTSRSRARRTGSPRPRWTSRSPASRRRSCAGPSTRRSRPRPPSSSGCSRRSRSPGRSSPGTLHGSRP